MKCFRRIRASVDRVEADVGDLKLRTTAIETHLGQMQIQMGQMQVRAPGSTVGWIGWMNGWAASNVASILSRVEPNNFISGAEAL